MGPDRKKLRKVKGGTLKEKLVINKNQRKRIYADFIKTKESKLLLESNIGDDFAAMSRDENSSLDDMYQSFIKHSSKAADNTILKISKKYGITEKRLIAIINEGDKKKWPCERYIK